MKVLYLHSYFDYFSHLLFFYTLPYKKCAFFTLLPFIVKKIFQRQFLKMDVAAFSGETFDAKDWINKALRASDPSQTKVRNEISSGVKSELANTTLT